MRAGEGRRAALAAGMLLALAACEEAPSTLAMRGTTGTEEARLGWYLVIVSAVVVVVVAVLVLVAALRGRRERQLRADEITAPEGSGLSWVLIGGVIVPTIILLVTFLFTVVTLRAVAAPARPLATTVRVVGHQWWWEVHYIGRSPDQEVTTANEIHLPVGEPVRVELASADVIHSFWVPELAGKTDIIPGQTNVSWVEAKSRGIYHGQCGEYCGPQHAHMQMRVVAESPKDFQAWLAAQRRPANAPVGAAADSGQQAFLTSGCATCHTIRGTPAGGNVGPDLTHLMSRGTIAGGTLPNNRGNLAAWVADAQGIKPGALMPTMAPQPKRLQQLLAYLEALQ